MRGSEDLYTKVKSIITSNNCDQFTEIVDDICPAGI